jgi:hypothetical protein
VRNPACNVTKRVSGDIWPDRSNIEEREGNEHVTPEGSSVLPVAVRVCAFSRGDKVEEEQNGHPLIRGACGRRIISM